MKKFRVRQTFHFYSDIEAEDEDEAISIAREEEVSGADVVEGLVDVEVVAVDGQYVEGIEW